MRMRLAAAVLALAGTPALAHRLDEYLQGTLVSVDRNRVVAQMTLTPGVAVFPFVVPNIDTNGDGIISEAEQRAYAARVLRDLDVISNGQPLTPQLVAMQFPSMNDMKEGRGEIRLDFRAELPPGVRNRDLVIENRHLGRISAYQVNCLVPQDPDIHISGQTRNYSQSRYRLDYVETDVSSGSGAEGSGAGVPVALGSVGLVLLARLVFLIRKRITGGILSVGNKGYRRVDV